jgi:hypothetical protein
LLAGRIILVVDGQRQGQGLSHFENLKFGGNSFQGLEILDKLISRP